MRFGIAPPVQQNPNRRISKHLFFEKKEAKNFYFGCAALGVGGFAAHPRINPISSG